MKIGIMQGRLSPPVYSLLQSFPTLTWEKEFKIAKDLGLDYIEWIFDNPYDNPLYVNAFDINNATKKTVPVINICADYFIKFPFFLEQDTFLVLNIVTLKNLIQNCTIINCKSITLPCLERASIKDTHKFNALVKNLKKVLTTIDSTDTIISIESDLEPARIKQLIECLNHPNFKITYDTGNSTANRFNPQQEIYTYGNHINNIHIKDRLAKGSLASVPYGAGDTDFKTILQCLKKIKYDGCFTLQLSREKNGDDEVQNVKNQLINFSEDIRRWFL